MFSTRYYENPVGGSTKICKRNYEDEIKYLKARLDIMTELYSAISKFMRSDLKHHIDDKDTIKSLFSIMGALDIEIPSATNEYSKLLAEYECDEGDKNAQKNN